MSTIAFEAEITESIKEAMKAKDQTRLDCLRAMKSALKYKDVEKSQAGVTQDEAISVFNTMIKQRKEAVEQYEKGGRDDAAKKEKYEIDVIMKFLPQQMSESEISALIQQTVSSLGAKGAADLGKVMKELKPKVTGRADGKLVSELVKKALG